MSDSDPLIFAVDSSQAKAGSKALDELTASSDRAEAAAQRQALAAARLAEAQSKAAVAAQRAEQEQTRLAIAAAKLAHEEQRAQLIALQMAAAAEKVAQEEAKAAQAVSLAEAASARAAKAQLDLERAHMRAAEAAKQHAVEEAALGAAAARALQELTQVQAVQVIRRDEAISWGVQQTAPPIHLTESDSRPRASDWYAEIEAQRRAAEAAEELKAAQERAAKAANDNLKAYQGLLQVLDPVNAEHIRYARQLQDIDKAVAAGNITSASYEQQLRATAKSQHEHNLKALEGEAATNRLAASLVTAGVRLAAFAGVVAIVGLSMLTRDLLNTASAYTQMEARLTMMSGSQEVARERMDALFVSADRVRAPVGELIQLFTRFSLATESMGLSARETMRLVETVGALVAVSGASASESAAGLRQLSQAFASGRFAGDEFRSVAENLPSVMIAFQDVLGKTQGELRQMARDGELTAQVMHRVFDAIHDKALKDLQEMPLTLSQAGTLMGNAWDRFLYDVDRAAAMTPALRDAVMALKDALSNPEVIEATVALFTQIANVLRWFAEDVIPFLARNWQTIAVMFATFAAGAGTAMITWALGFAAAFGPLAPLIAGLVVAVGALTAGVMWLVGAFESERTTLEVLTAAHENHERQIRATERAHRELLAIAPEIERMNKRQAESYLEKARAALAVAEAQMAVLGVNRAIAGATSSASEIAYAVADDAYKSELKLRQENSDYDAAIADPYLETLKRRRDAAEAAKLANDQMEAALSGQGQKLAEDMAGINAIIESLKKRVEEAPDYAGGGASEESVQKLREQYDRAIKIKREYEESVRQINAARGPNLSDAEADRMLVEAKEEMTAKLEALDRQRTQSNAKSVDEQAKALADLQRAYDPLAAEHTRHLKALKEIDDQLGRHNGLTLAEADAYRVAEAALHAKNLASIEQAAIQAKAERSRAVHAEAAQTLSDGAGSDYWSGLEAGLDGYLDSFETGFDLMQRLGRDTFQGIEDALVDFVLTGKASFGDLINSMIADLVRFAIQQAIMKPLTNWFMGLFHDGGIVGSGGSIINVGRFHGGGHAGAANDNVAVNAAVFGSAERYHGGGATRQAMQQRMGLANDELPAILQIGEIVLSRRHVQKLREHGMLDYVKALVANDNARALEAATGTYGGGGWGGQIDSYHEGGDLGGGGSRRSPFPPGFGGGGFGGAPGAISISIPISIGGGGGGAGSGGQDDPQRRAEAERLGRVIEGKVRQTVVEVLQNEQRPRGLLNPGGFNS